MRIVVFLSILLSCTGALAAPVAPATLDRSTWPEQLTTPALFDVASRAEILTFARALLISEALDEAGLKQRLGLKMVNLLSVNGLRQRLWQRLLTNYNLAQQSCEQDASFCYYVEDIDSLREQAGKFQVGPDSFYIKWAEPSRTFHERYLDELLRSAALFPQVTSEVDRFGEYERDGSELNDRLFTLTFDGGPGTAPGQTDWMTDYLRKQKMSATFFVLGNSLQARVDKTSVSAVRELYARQCVGVMGWEYRSHSHWQDWEASVRRSAALVQSVAPESYVPMFRPPDGQRRADAEAFFAAQGLQVALWNIDAEDGSGKLTAEQSGQRVLSLMLLWRHGVIVFHDTQDRARSALPWLFKSTAESGIGWQACRSGF